MQSELSQRVAKLAEDTVENLVYHLSLTNMSQLSVTVHMGHTGELHSMASAKVKVFLSESGN